VSCIAFSLQKKAPLWGAFLVFA